MLGPPSTSGWLYDCDYRRFHLRYRLRIMTGETLCPACTSLAASRSPMPRLCSARWPPLRARTLPDGETAIRKTWIRFQQDLLAENPAIERADDLPPFKCVQWHGKLIRELPRLRLRPGAGLDPSTFHIGYAEMGISSWDIFNRLQHAGVIPATVKFQVSLSTPIAPVYNNMVPSNRRGCFLR